LVIGTPILLELQTVLYDFMAMGIVKKVKGATAGVKLKST